MTCIYTIYIFTGMFAVCLYIPFVAKFFDEFHHNCPGNNTSHVGVLTLRLMLMNLLPALTILAILYSTHIARNAINPLAADCPAPSLRNLHQQRQVSQTSQFGTRVAKTNGQALLVSVSFYVLYSLLELIGLIWESSSSSPSYTSFYDITHSLLSPARASILLLHSETVYSWCSETCYGRLTERCPTAFTRFRLSDHITWPRTFRKCFKVNNSGTACSVTKQATFVVDVAPRTTAISNELRGKASSKVASLAENSEDNKAEHGVQGEIPKCRGDASQHCRPHLSTQTNCAFDLNNSEASEMKIKMDNQRTPSQESIFSDFRNQLSESCIAIPGSRIADQRMSNITVDSYNPAMMDPATGNRRSTKDGQKTSFTQRIVQWTNMAANNTMPQDLTPVDVSSSVVNTLVT